MIQYIIFGIGVTIFMTYMFFLLRMINITHKQQEKENGPNETTKEMVEKVLKDLEYFKNESK
jgi:MFS superfamily sulfate permease-like transporter